MVSIIALCFPPSSSCKTHIVKARKHNIKLLENVLEDQLTLFIQNLLTLHINPLFVGE